MPLRSTLLVTTWLALAWANTAQAQLFGARSLGTPLSRRAAPGGGDVAQG